jgi:hypothetical protein
MLCEQAHFCDGGASFLLSTCQVASFVQHPTDVLELPDKNLDCLTFMSEFIQHNALMTEKNKQHCFHSQAYMSCFVGVRQSRALPV